MGASSWITMAFGSDHRQIEVFKLITHLPLIHGHGCTWFYIQLYCLSHGEICSKTDALNNLSEFSWYDVSLSMFGYGLACIRGICVHLSVYLVKIDGSVWHAIHYSLISFAYILMLVFGDTSNHYFKQTSGKTNSSQSSALGHCPPRALDLRRVYCKAYVHTRAVQKTTWQR